MYTVKDLSKSYGGVKALDGVDFEVLPGEVHALLGANGAGKSTLIKVMVGGTDPDEGAVLELEGEPVAFNNSREAADRGVAIVSQELTLFPHLDVLQNLFLGREPRTAGFALDRRAMRRQAQPVLERIGLDVDVNRSVDSLRLGEQQLVEIARALLEDPKILVLDEPTSALQKAETERLLNVVRGLRDRGVAVVYVSHFLEDVFAVADRITVLRSGRVVVARRPREEMTIQGTVVEMLGEAAVREQREGQATPFEEAAAANAPLVLEEVEVTGSLQPFSLTAKPGEIVGLAGLDGSGAQTVLDVIFGRRRLAGGTISLPGKARRPRTMNQAVRAGVAYVPADRKRLGLMLDSSVAANVASVRGGPLRRMGVVLRNGRMRNRAEHWREELKILMPNSKIPAGSLSGGNQQKVVFAKWLEAEPSVVLLDDPSRGVDMGAKEDMHAIIAQMAASKKVVLYTSSDLEEMAKVCDRVIVFFAGRAVGELSSSDLSEHRLLEAINVGSVPVAG
jgi:ABC-type sugar transport system ATPase subunit